MESMPSSLWTRGKSELFELLIEDGKLVDLRS